jgi:hypothetical protein
MPSSRKSPIRGDRSGVIGAGATGGGVGAIVAALASTLPDGSPVRVALTVSAPYIAVSISGLGLFLKSAYLDPFVRSRKEQLLKDTFDKALNEARAERTRILADPAATQEHKDQVIEIVEKLERLQLRNMTERLEVVLAE